MRLEQTGGLNQNAGLELPVIVSEPTPWGNSEVFTDSEFTYMSIPGLSERQPTYLTMMAAIAGTLPEDSGELSRIKADVAAGVLPRFLVTQAFRDSAGSSLDADPDATSRFFRLQTHFFGTDHDRAVEEVNNKAMHKDNALVKRMGAWVSQAACKKIDPSLFHTDRTESPEPQKETCRSCPVADDCLDFAVSNSIKHGTWGGLSERERRRVRKLIKADKSKAEVQEVVLKLRAGGLRSLNQAS